MFDCNSLTHTEHLSKISTRQRLVICGAYTRNWMLEKIFKHRTVTTKANLLSVNIKCNKQFTINVHLCNNCQET